ncbi:hypothetical protein MYX84_10795 [Acidobacteria bacterium AH-259-O06]|nr:hypothetical protein [Acidobacteria bacterium AH-259-O06]
MTGLARPAAPQVGRTVFLILSLCGLSTISFGDVVETGVEDSVTTLGSVEVTAKLLEIPGRFPSNDLYGYATF